MLRNLVKLGYCDMPEVRKELANALATQQIDGGYPCVSKIPKIKKPNLPHKSCFQMSASYLLLMAELRRIGHKCDKESGLAEYFLGRDVLFRHDDPNRVVKEEMGAPRDKNRASHDTLLAKSFGQSGRSALQTGVEYS